MFADEGLYAALNIPAITDMLDAYGQGKALFNAMVLPSDFTLDKSINFYFNFRQPGETDIYEYTINCRSDIYNTTQGSLSIAKKVYDEIHRKNYNGYYIFCTLGNTIPPEDNQDNYNTPITAIIKMR